MSTMGACNAVTIFSAGSRNSVRYFYFEKYAVFTDVFLGELKVTQLPREVFSCYGSK